MTQTRCAHCPVTEGLPCRAGMFCDWAEAGNPVHLRHIVAVATRDAGRPAPIQSAMPCQDAAPGFLQKAANFGKAIVTHVAAGMPVADEATVAARWATCRACPMFDAVGVTCRACGCFLNVKIKMNLERCPLNKW